MIKLLLPVLIALTIAPLLPAFASDTLAEIKEKVAFRKEMMQLINSGDPATQMAAVEQALAGDDSELRISARQVAFSSDSERLQRLALRLVLNNSSRLQLKVDMPDHSDEAQQLIHSRFHAFSFNKMVVGPSNDTITVANEFWAGRLIKGGFLMSYKRVRPLPENYNCTITVKIASPDLLVGKLDCLIISRDALRKTKGKNRAILPLRIYL